MGQARNMKTGATAGTRLACMTMDTVLGQVLVAENERGICRAELAANDRVLLQRLAADFPSVAIVPLPARRCAELRRYLSAVIAGAAPARPPAGLRLDLQGTPFQLRVWHELQRIPRGTTRSYAEIARRIGQPGAARAVAGACASNPVALFIPCHRVVRRDGALAGYRWGLVRKRALLTAEKAPAAP
jgi:AraC family transcriptional regulator, regulatory protein of adaptative response / methylated-DNA-[protein]-cysteine methyltransferase